jgi:hypothetical protein
MSAGNRLHEDYDVAWICALPLEMAAANFMLDETYGQLPQSTNDENTYTLGKIYGYNVVVTCLPAGVYSTIAGATVISHMRSTFPNIRFCLMVGIGGGVPSKKNDIRLGDDDRVAVSRLSSENRSGATTSPSRISFFLLGTPPPIPTIKQNRIFGKVDRIWLIMIYQSQGQDLKTSELHGRNRGRDLGRNSLAHR